MSNGENAPFRLDQSRERAMTAAGVPNASRVDEKLERTYRGTMKIADLTDLSPHPFAPRYGVRISLTTAARATLELVCPVPFELVYIDPVGTNTEIGANPGTPLVTGASTATFADPAPTLAPRQGVFTQGDTGTQVNGLLVEANRGFPPGLVFEPGVRMQLQADAVGGQLFASFIIQEYPGGVARSNQS